MVKAKKTLKVMVCVTRQKTCERLIKIGEELVLEHEGELLVVHVAKEGVSFLGNPNEGEALEYLFQISKRVGAEMTVLRSSNIVNTLENFALKNNIAIIIVGESPDYQEDNNVIRQLRRRLPDLKFKIVPTGHFV